MTTGFTGKRQLQPFTVGPVRNLVIPQREFAAIVQAPDAINARNDHGIVSGRVLGPQVTVHYAFGSQGEMTDHFTSLFKEMLETARASHTLRDVLLTLEDNPSRPWVEPLYGDVGFRRLEEWVRMVLPDPQAWQAQAGLDAGLSARPATDADRSVVVEIDRACFGDRALGDDGQKALAETTSYQAVGEAGGKVVGYVQVRRTADNAAEIYELAVLPEERGKRYGSQLLEHALSWIADTEARDEMTYRRVEVTVPTSEAASLDLMRRYGFSAQRSGNTYRRPADDAAVAAATEEAKRNSFLLRFGDWR